MDLAKLIAGLGLGTSAGAGAGSGSGAGAGAGSSSPAIPEAATYLPADVAGTVGKDTLASNFCRLLREFLSALATELPHHSSLGTWLTKFDMFMTTLPNAAKYTVEKWHYDMTVDEEGNEREPSLYVLTAKRDMEAVFNTPIALFESISAWELYTDPVLNEGDREMVCAYLDSLNAQAQLYTLMPVELERHIITVASKLDPRAPVTAETIQNLVQEVLAENTSSFTSSETMMELASKFVPQMGNVTDPQVALSQILSSLMQDPTLSSALGGITPEMLTANVAKAVARGPAPPEAPLKTEPSTT